MPRPKASSWRRSSRSLKEGDYQGHRIYTDEKCREIVSLIPNNSNYKVSLATLRNIIFYLEFDLIGELRPNAGSRRFALQKLAQAVADAQKALVELDDASRGDLEAAASEDNEHAEDVPSFTFYKKGAGGNEAVKVSLEPDKGYLRVKSDCQAVERIGRWAAKAAADIPIAAHTGGNSKLEAERIAIAKLLILWNVISHRSAFAVRDFTGFVQAALFPIMDCYSKSRILHSTVREVIDYGADWPDAKAYEQSLLRERDRPVEF